ncbi:MAG: Phosphomannomutase [uncultured Frankineae bacterium]|uniref:Phosphomannomutase n=1 Tax=uncultured Frankineae bacterium TaxID=437475 RepID=A0A6J4L5D9_9ACTN|nr:MAG: Phosphomannomutase [uncultured Frankineae bacterium]
MQAWIADDPDPLTREELTALLAAGDTAELADRFSGPLHFGTAGIRGPVRGGPQGMNRAVVRRAAAGLAAHLGPGRSVVVGRDARHGSEQFCADVGAVLAGAGLRALLLPRALPTPVLAFAVRFLGVDAGVMVTASHNPPRDNGLKVYLADGAQLSSPHDVAVERAIGAVGRVLDLPLGEAELLGDEVWQAYVSAVAALPRSTARDVRIAYTPMHGVGLETVLAAFARAGFPAPEVVAEQAAPDPDFPTVAFPNPEEPGALDLLLRLSADADVAIASDPDADRIAVAVGGRALRGDETGVLLADHLLASGVRGRLATTVVSSSMLARLAAAHDVPFSETLTGFKNLVRAGDDLVYAYEEALGVAASPATVRDKDGISAALLVAELAALEKARGRTLLHRLADLERRFGRHETRQLSYRVRDLSLIAAAVDDLRASPPSAYGAAAVTAVEQPADDVLVHRLDGGRVVVRPSGTEPKLKAYLELVDPAPGAMDALAQAVDARLGLG